MRRLAILLCVLLTVLPGSALAAKKKPLHVLIVQSEDAYAQAQALTDALRRAVLLSDEYTPAEGEFSLEVLTLALGCSEPPDENCLTQIAAKIKSHQFVWGIMERQGKKLVVRMRMWQRGSNGSEVVARYGPGQDQDRLTEVAVKLLARLSGEPSQSSLAEAAAESADPEPGSEKEPQGDLVIYAGNVDGQIVIDGRARGKIKNGFAKLALPAGEHEVLIRAAGYYEAIEEVSVEPRRRAEVTLNPELRNRSRSRSSTEQAGGSSGAGWAAIGFGGLLVAGGAYSAIKVKSINEDPEFTNYRAQFPTSQNACREAERGSERPGTASAGEIARMCEQARTYEALQYLFFGLGGVAIGTGAVILLSGGGASSEPPERDHARRPKIKAEPRVAVGRTSAEVALHLEF
jgi:hypothetical protein